MKTMRNTSGEGYSRRMFLAKMSALGAASFLGLRTAVAAEPPPEVQKIRLVHAPAICLSPQYLAEELLRLEGFSEIQYVDQPMTKSLGPLEAGQADMTQGAGVDVVAALDAGRAILPLAGIHAGCYELFVNGPIAGIKALAGKSVAITTDDSTERLFLSSIVAHIGVNPRDMRWITAASAADASRPSWTARRLRSSRSLHKAKSCGLRKGGKGSKVQGGEEKIEN
jgi:NitT/TauT family transport system substrate-binding protein